MNELKPCPFCGRQPIISADKRKVACINSKCHMDFAPYVFPHEWNTHTPSAIEKAAKGLVKFCEPWRMSTYIQGLKVGYGYKCSFCGSDKPEHAQSCAWLALEQACKEAQ